MHFTFVDILKYKEGTVYCGIQYSETSKKTRFVAYGTDYIHFHDCTGTSGSNPLINATIIIEHLRSMINKLDTESLINIVPAQAYHDIKTGTYTIGI